MKTPHFMIHLLSEPFSTYLLSFFSPSNRKASAGTKSLPFRSRVGGVQLDLMQIYKKGASNASHQSHSNVSCSPETDERPVNKRVTADHMCLRVRQSHPRGTNQTAPMQREANERTCCIKEFHFSKVKQL